LRFSAQEGKDQRGAIYTRQLARYYLQDFQVVGQFEFLTQRVTNIEIQTAVLSCFHSTLRTAFFALPAGRFLRETGALIFDDLRAIQLRPRFSTEGGA